MGFEVCDFLGVSAADDEIERSELKNKVIGFWTDLWKKIVDESHPKKAPIRNLKELVLNEALASGNSGIIAIFITARLRLQLRESLLDIPNPGLQQLLSEWIKQEDEPRTFDTLQYVFCKHPDIITRTHRAMALVEQVRRIRRGYQIGEPNILIAEKLVKEAFVLVGADEDDEVEIEPFHIIDSNFELIIKVQEVLNLGRTANQSEVKKASKKYEESIIKAHRDDLFGQGKSGVRADLWLRWWSWRVRNSAATLTFDWKLFEDSRKKMRKLEDELSDTWTGWDGWFAQRKKRKSITYSIADDNKHLVNRLWKFFDIWKKFHPKHDSMIVSSGGKKSQEYSESRDARMLYDEFNNGDENSRTLFRVIHNNHDIGRRDYQKISISSREFKQQRVATVLAEVKNAHLAVKISDSHLAYLLLELLHRNLMYRLWWESAGYNRDGAERDDEPLFNSKHVISILKDIRKDLNKWGSKDEEWNNPKNSVDQSILFMETQNVNWTQNLRIRLEEFSSPIDFNVEIGQKFFLGIPFGSKGADSYEVMHPFETWVGANPERRE